MVLSSLIASLLSLNAPFYPQLRKSALVPSDLNNFVPISRILLLVIVLDRPIDQLLAFMNENFAVCLKSFCQDFKTYRWF